MLPRLQRLEPIRKPENAREIVGQILEKLDNDNASVADMIVVVILNFMENRHLASVSVNVVWEHVIFHLGALCDERNFTEAWARLRETS